MKTIGFCLTMLIGTTLLVCYLCPTLVATISFCVLSNAMSSLQRDYTNIWHVGSIRKVATIIMTATLNKKCYKNCDFDRKLS